MTRLAPVAALLATALVTTGCTAATAESEPSPNSPVGVTFGHVHGLGVDSGSGALFVASHQGLFEIGTVRAGEFTTSEALALGPIAGHSHDFMGFEMHQQRMYASGHPNPLANLDLAEPNLGLIISDDSGTTWTPVSLHGEVDFHDIAVTTTEDGATRVYAYDSGAGTVLISDDGGENWTAGARTPIRDLTTDIDDPDIVYATTQEGLAVSRDAGATFSVDPDAPPLWLLETTADGLIGVATDGTIWQRDANGPWRSTGSTEGDVEAMTWVAEPESLLLVMDARGISASRDSGKNWETILPAG